MPLDVLPLLVTAGRAALVATSLPWLAALVVVLSWGRVQRLS